jgi:hypothetical protein
MADIKATLRYFPLGAVAGPAEPIQKKDIDAIAKKHGVSISLEEVKGKGAEINGDVVREETMNSAVEDVTQSVITMTTDSEKDGSAAMLDILKKYRAPRTVFGTLGSNEEGKMLVSQCCEEYDGWQ